MSQVAVDVIELQQIFDLAFDQECSRMAPFTDIHPLIDPLVDQALLPRRIFVGKQKLHCSLRVEQEKKLGFGLEVKTIPLSFELLMEKKSLHKQKITISVEQIPIVKHPLSKEI